MTCNIAFHDTPVDWQEVGLASQTQTQAALPPEAETEAAGESDTQQGQAEKNHASAMRTLRKSLEAKGFRADLLAQIADEDLADLQGCEILNVRVIDYDEAQNGERSSKMQGSIIYVQTAGVETKAFFLYAYLDAGIIESRIRGSQTAQASCLIMSGTRHTAAASSVSGAASC